MVADGAPLSVKNGGFVVAQCVGNILRSLDLAEKIKGMQNPCLTLWVYVGFVEFRGFVH